MVRRLRQASSVLAISMFTLSLQRDFTAQHYLIGGDWGAENALHEHNYRLELHLQGEGLNQHGYLVDIVEVEHLLDQELENYQGATLNDLTEFDGLNPSLEYFSRILCSSLARHFRTAQLASVKVRLWEDETAWASYRLEF